VLTTGEAPMTEVGGYAAFYISNKAENDAFTWANKSAQVLESALHLSPEEKQLRRANGFAQADKFDSQQTIYKYEAIYQRIVTDSAV
jgi:hypothetical protein